MRDKGPKFLDGTDQLLTVLYGESSARTIPFSLGGSNARMLIHAAEIIGKLRVEIAKFREDNRRLKVVLRPLAQILIDLEHEADTALSVGHEFPLDDDSKVEIEVKHLRRAYEALNGAIDG